MQAAKENFRVQTELSGCQLTSEMRNRLSFCLIINLELLALAFLMERFDIPQTVKAQTRTAQRVKTTE